MDVKEVGASIRQEGGRVWAIFLVLAVGLWLISRPEPHNVILWNYAKLPAAFGAWACGSWLTWQTLFHGVSARQSPVGAALSVGVMLAWAWVVAGVIG